MEDKHLREINTINHKSTSLPNNIIYLVLMDNNKKVAITLESIIHILYLICGA